MGCGILKREIRHLIAANNWPLDTFFFDSALHCDFKELEDCLRRALTGFRGRKTIVFYGTCHPRMDALLEDAHTFRTVGQNCVEILLGKARFTEELAQGAFFLMEDWARRWERITFKAFGTRNVAVIRDIYQGDRKYMLALRTPCSSDFTDQAEAAARMVGLPIRWMDTTLEHLHEVLAAALARRMEESA